MSALVGREKIVVVGHGMVGHRFCERLAASGGAERMDVSVFAEERCPAYDRVSIGEILRGRDPTTMSLVSAAWYEEHGFSLHLGDPIAEIDLAGKRARSRSGVVTSFDRLILATGSAPVIPAIQMGDGCADACLTLRTLQDMSRLRDRLADVGRTVIMGGGLLGIETALALSAMNIEVTVVEAGPHVLPGLLDHEGALALTRSLGKRRIEVRAGVTVRALWRKRMELSSSTGRSEHYLLDLSSPERLQADLVIVAAGVRPRDELARSAGLELGPRGGVLVSELLQSSHPDVYAIGECAVRPGLRIGHVAPGYRMADALAHTVLGEPEAFCVPLEPVRLKAPEIDVVLVGRSALEAATSGARSKRQPMRAFVKTTPTAYSKLVVDRGRVVGAQVVGASGCARQLSRAVADHRRLGALARRRFLAKGEPWPQQAPRERLATEVVCACGHVTLGQLRSAIAGGCRTVKEVCASTGAGRGCGTCVVEIAPLVEPGALVRHKRPSLVTPALGAISVAAVVAALRVPLPTTSSLVNGVTWSHRLAVLWTDPAWQAVTGIVQVGLFALALLFPLLRVIADRRKDHGSPRDASGARLFHAAIGVLAVGVGIVHTGGRLGANLNLGLALGSAGLLGLGGLVAALMGAAPRRTLIRKISRIARMVHMTLLWPVLALIGIHLFAVLHF
jgi:nitrite reductase (NADH) large subunit